MVHYFMVVNRKFIRITYSMCLFKNTCVFHEIVVIWLEKENWESASIGLSKDTLSRYPGEVSGKTMGFKSKSGKIGFLTGMGSYS